MQPSGEVGRFEMDDQPSPPADRRRYLAQSPCLTLINSGFWKPLAQMNHDHDSSELLTFVTMNEDGSFKINIYGTPNGLKNLAEALLKQAGVDQSTMTYLKDYDTDHTHYKPTFKGSILSPSSDELQLGRLDVRTGELASWAKERIRSSGDGG